MDFDFGAGDAVERHGVRSLLPGIAVLDVPRCQGTPQNDHDNSSRDNSVQASSTTTATPLAMATTVTAYPPAHSHAHARPLPPPSKGFGGGGASTSKKGGKKGGKAKAGKVTKGISTVTRVPEDPSELCVCSSGKPYGECCKVPNVAPRTPRPPPPPRP